MASTTRTKPSSQHRGLYIITLEPEINKLTAEASSRPAIAVCRFMKHMEYNHVQYLPYISCMQMTNTGIFFNWYPIFAPGPDWVLLNKNMIHCIQV
jgi:hypothetical protein